MNYFLRSIVIDFSRLMVNYFLWDRLQTIFQDSGLVIPDYETTKFFIVVFFPAENHTLNSVAKSTRKPERIIHYLKKIAHSLNVQVNHSTGLFVKPSIDLLP